MIKNNIFLINKIKYFPLSSLNTILFPYFTFSTDSKQVSNIINTAYDLENINWYNLNKNGYVTLIKTKLEKRPGIYIYQNILYKNKIYIGSSVNIVRRLIDHKNSSNKNPKICPKFYNCVNKYGWNNFRVGVLEYIDLNINENVINKGLLRESLLKREQFYFDIINPALNVNKIAGSTLGFKHSEETRLAMGLNRRGKSINWLKQDFSYIISEETRNNLSLRCRHGVIVKVVDKDNNIIKIFPSIVSTANFYDLDHNTISKYIKNRSSFKNLYFLAELKDVRVWILDKERTVVNIFSNAQKTAKFCGTNHTTIYRYLKSKKLWKNKYYFSSEARRIL